MQWKKKPPKICPIDLSFTNSGGVENSGKLLVQIWACINVSNSPRSTRYSKKEFR